MHHIDALQNVNISICVFALKNADAEILNKPIYSHVHVMLMIPASNLGKQTAAAQAALVCCAWLCSAAQLFENKVQSLFAFSFLVAEW